MFVHIFELSSTLQQRPQVAVGVSHFDDGPWPFTQCGLDILGPFPLRTKHMKFLVVGIDYFTKWVEAELLAKITQQNVKNFIWKNIICKFGMLRVLISENGWQFNNTLFKDFCEHFGIKNHYSSPFTRKQMIK